MTTATIDRTAEITAVIRDNRASDPDYLAARIARRLAELDGTCQGNNRCECWTENADQIADIIRVANPNWPFQQGVTAVALAERINTEVPAVAGAPAEPTTVTFTADQLGALKALLGLVHYDNLAQEWFNLLPAEIRQAVRKR